MLWVTQCRVGGWLRPCLGWCSAGCQSEWHCGWWVFTSSRNDNHDGSQSAQQHQIEMSIKVVVTDTCHRSHHQIWAASNWHQFLGLLTSVMTESTKEPWLHRSRLSNPINQSGDGTSFVITEIWNGIGFILGRKGEMMMIEAHLFHLVTGLVVSSFYAFYYLENVPNPSGHYLNMWLTLRQPEWMNKSWVWHRCSRLQTILFWLHFLANIRVLYTVGRGAVMSHVSPLNLTFLESKGSSEVVMIHTEELVPSILLFTNPAYAAW